MILETDLDDDAHQNESESDAITDRHGVPPEDASTVTVEVERPTIKTVARMMVILILTRGLCASLKHVT